MENKRDATYQYQSESNGTLSKTFKESTPLLFAQERSQLKLRQKIAYGVGHVYNDICAAIWFSYALIYLQLVAETGPVMAGTFLFIGQTVDACATPFAGFVIGRFSTKKIWHLIGSVLVGLTFPLIFSTWKLIRKKMWSQVIYYSSVIFVFQTGWAIVQIAHLSLLTDMTPLTAERAELTAHRYTFSMASHILVYLIAWAFFSDIEGMNMKLISNKDSLTFQYICVLASCIGLLCTVFFHMNLRKTWTNTTQSAHGPDDDTSEQKVKDLMLSTNLYKVAILYTSSRLILTLSLVYFPMFINEVVLSKSTTLATVPLVSFLASCLASMTVKSLSWQIGGNRVMYVLGCVMCAAGSALVRMHVTKSDETWQILLAAVLFGAGSSVTMVVSLCVTANLVGPHTEHSAFIYSAVTTGDKLINGIAVVTIEYWRCEDDEDCPFYYRDILSYVNLTIASIGLIISLTVSYKLFKKSDAN